MCLSNSSIISACVFCVATWRAVRPSCTQRVVTGQQGERHLRHVYCDGFGYLITLARPGIARIGRNPNLNPNNQHTSHHASSSPPHRPKYTSPYFEVRSTLCVAATAPLLSLVYSSLQHEELCNRSACKRWQRITRGRHVRSDGIYSLIPINHKPKSDPQSLILVVTWSLTVITNI